MKVLLQAIEIVLFTFLSSQNASAATFSFTAGVKVATNIIQLSQSNHNNDDAPFQFIDENENENPSISSSSTCILHQRILDECRRGKAHLSPSFVHSIKNKMGIVSSFHNSLTADSETGVLVGTHLYTETTPVHRDHYPADKDGKRLPVREDREVAFVFLNSNPDAYFQHGDMSVPVVKGSLVYFNGRVAHNTVVNSGVVHLLGPFEVGPLMGSEGIIGGIGSECGSNEELMEIIINLDSKAEETSWRIWDKCRLEIFQEMKYDESDSNSIKSYHYCADKNSRYELVLYDSAGDGIELRGSYVLSFKFGSFDYQFDVFATGYAISLPVLSCTVGTDCNECVTSQSSLSPAPSTSMIPSSVPTTSMSPTAIESTNPSSVPTIESVNPSFVPTESMNPSSAPTVSMIPTAYPESGAPISLSISFVWTCLGLVISCLMITF